MQHTNGKCEHLRVHCKMCEICLLGPGPQAPTGECPWALLGDFHPKPPLPKSGPLQRQKPSCAPASNHFKATEKLANFESAEIFKFELSNCKQRRRSETINLTDVTANCLIYQNT